MPVEEPSAASETRVLNAGEKRHLRHDRYFTFQLPNVAEPCDLSPKTLPLID